MAAGSCFARAFQSVESYLPPGIVTADDHAAEEAHPSDAGAAHIAPDLRVDLLRRPADGLVPNNETTAS